MEVTSLDHSIEVVCSRVVFVVLFQRIVPSKGSEYKYFSITVKFLFRILSKKSFVSSIWVDFDVLTFTNLFSVGSFVSNKDL